MNKEKIKEIRKSLNLTQKEFAEKLNVSDRTIRNWESGKKEPGKRSLKDLNNVTLVAEIFNKTLTLAAESIAKFSSALGNSALDRGGIVPPNTLSGDNTSIPEHAIIDPEVLAQIEYGLPGCLSATKAAQEFFENKVNKKEGDK